MEYLKRRDEDNRLLRSSLRIAVPWARSVIVCAANYNADAPRSTDPASAESAWIARYAWTGYRSDSSQARRGRATTTMSSWPGSRSWSRGCKLALGPFPSRCYVDTGPLVERVYALYAGIGWIGKNTCILDQQLGSWLFLGVILTGIELPAVRTVTLPEDRCGSCTRCIDACPTGALIAPYQMDASLCIAYLTIEKRGPIPEPLRSQMGRQVFGCDICQDVCPWNRRAPAEHRSRAGGPPGASEPGPRLACRTGCGELSPAGSGNLLCNAPSCVACCAMWRSPWGTAALPAMCPSSRSGPPPRIRCSPTQHDGPWLASPLQRRTPATASDPISGAAYTFAALSPLGPCWHSNSTASPSFRVLYPFS